MKLTNAVNAVKNEKSSMNVYRLAVLLVKMGPAIASEVCDSFDSFTASRILRLMNKV